MQNITAANLEYLMSGGYVAVNLTADLLNATQVQIDGALDVLDGSLQISRESATGNRLSIGDATASELTLTLMNLEDKFTGMTFEGGKLYPVFNVNGELIPGGVYTVDQKPSSGLMLELRALDNMARFNRLYDSDLAYPTTAQNILIDACNQCGVPLKTSSIPNGSYVASEKPTDCTYHDIIRWIAQITGGNAYCDHLGELVIAWYSATPNLMLDDIDYFEIELAESDVTVTGIECATEDDEILLAGSEGYTLDISDNELIKGNPEPILSALNAVLNGFTYRPTNNLKLPLMPHLWTGDRLGLTHNGTEYQTIVTQHEISHGGTSLMSGAGEPETVKGYATGAPFTQSQQRVLRSVSRRVAHEVIPAYEQAALQLNEQIASALGYYPTDIVNPDGSKTRYLHDKPTLEESQYISIQAAPGLHAWTVNGWNNGSPTWNYGTTQSGSMIMRMISAVGINAEWINLESKSLLEALDELSSYITVNTNNITSLETRFGQFEYVNVDGEQILLKDHISSLTAKQLDFLTRDHLSNVSYGVRINGALIELASIPSSAVGIGDETLEDTLAKLQQSISQVSGAGTNFIQNSNLGTYEAPSTVWWSTGMSAQHFDARNITVSAFDGAGITVAMFDRGDF